MKYKNIIFDIKDVLFRIETDYEASQAEGRVVLRFIPIDAGINILKACKAKSYKIFGLSNMSDGKYQCMQEQHPEVVALFDDVIISDHVGYKKPDREMFEHLLEKHSLDQGESIFMDDNITNVTAAVDLGFTAVVVHDFAEVTEKLKRIQVL